jgi:hypothetical protein
VAAAVGCVMRERGSARELGAVGVCACVGGEGMGVWVGGDHVGEVDWSGCCRALLALVACRAAAARQTRRAHQPTMGEPVKSLCK